MATLNQIVTQIADALNRPFDDMLKNRLKDVVIQQFGLFVSRSISQYGIDREFIYSYDVSQFKHVTTKNNVALTIPYYESVNPIPTPLRYKSDTPFVYVGGTQGDTPFSFRNLHARTITNSLPNIGISPAYDFRDSKLYIWNTPISIINGTEPTPTDATIPLLIRQVPDDPRNIASPDVLQAMKFNADSEFPITMDLVQQIKESIIKGELLITDHKDKVESTHLDNV